MKGIVKPLVVKHDKKTLQDMLRGGIENTPKYTDGPHQTQVDVFPGESFNKP